MLQSQKIAKVLELQIHGIMDLILLLVLDKWACAWENQQFGFWPGMTQTRLYSYWRWLEARNFVFRKKRYCTIQIAKTKALISFTVTAKLIFVFVFAYANCWFSHARAQITQCIETVFPCIVYTCIIIYKYQFTVKIWIFRPDRFGQTVQT